MSANSFKYLMQDMSEPEGFQLMGGTLAVYSARSPGKLTDNEDAAAVLPCGDDCGVLIVADGMGGGAVGEQASRIAVESIKSEVDQQIDGDDTILRSAILNGLESGNQEILDLGVGAATTIAAVEIQGHLIRPYHVGDSSILVVGQRGKIKLQTVAHSPVSLAVEAGILDDAEAMHHEDRHLVTNMLGTPDMRIEIGSTIQLSRFDTVLLATDGLFDNMAIEEVVERIRKGPLLQGLEQVIEVTASRMENSEDGVPSKPDDLTIIAFRLNSPA
ncbi:MAG: serine/threonine-protein phosphatase [Planctomycetales bacterium]|nr:serine/threonine-protein phosphatase [Planctomycetales bacterium]